MPVTRSRTVFSGNGFQIGPIPGYTNVGEAKPGTRLWPGAGVWFPAHRIE